MGRLFCGLASLFYCSPVNSKSFHFTFYLTPLLVSRDNGMLDMKSTICCDVMIALSRKKIYIDELSMLMS